MTLHNIHWLLIILSVLDVATTVYALRNRTGVAEGNPVMAAAMGKLGITPALVLLKVVALGALFWLVPVEGNEQGYWAAVAVMVAVVLNNLYAIKRTKK